MKQVFIGLGVFIVFVVYSLWVRHELPVIAVPQTLKMQATTGAGSDQSSNAPSTGATGDGTPSTPPTQSSYSNGTFTGSVADAYYGNVQVRATISGGKITDVSFLQYPDTHDTSVMINQQAMPYLRQEAIQSQSSDVQIISGATFTSEAFIQSLAAALSQARIA